MDRYNLQISIAVMNTPAEYIAFLQQASNYQLLIIQFQDIGRNNGGNHRVTLQGTADDLTRWFNEVYNPGATYTFSILCRNHLVVRA